MPSDLERIAQGLIEYLDANPRIAADLAGAAAECQQLAAEVAELAAILPQAAAVAEYLQQAANDCGEAAQRSARATVIGRNWAVEAVGSAGSGAVAPAGRDAAAGNSPKRKGPPHAKERQGDGEILKVEPDLLPDLPVPDQIPAEEVDEQRIDPSRDDPNNDPVSGGPPVSPAGIEELSLVVALASGRKGAWNEELNNPAPSTTYEVDGRYSFSTDERGRTMDVKGTLTMGKKDRSEHRQRIAGGADRKIGLDDGGHVIANRFMGPSEAINIVAQLRAQNRASALDRANWNAVERLWADAMAGDPPMNVEVSIAIKYPEDSLRPASFRVRYRIGDGNWQVRRFNN